DSPSLTFAVGTGPTHGSLGAVGTPSCTPSGAGSTCTATVTYTPTTGYAGPDSFTFTTNDSLLSSTAATVTITVANDPPVAVNDTATESKNSVNNTINVLANDSDPNGDTLTVTAVTTPAHGTSGVASGGSGATYSPTAGYTGSDTFTYTVSDGGGGTAVGTVTVTVNNNPPTANGQSTSTAEDTPVTITLTGSDPNGDALTFGIGNPPTHGSLGAVTPLTSTSASVIYTPAADYNGSDGFTFLVNDGTVNSSPAAVTLTVTPVNDPPITTNHAVTTAQNTAVNLTLTASDIDSPTLTFSVVTGPVNGTLSAITGTTCTPSGAGATCTASVTYTPTTGYTGPDSFAYQASDGSLNSNVATVNATVFVDSDGDGIQDGIDIFQGADASTDPTNNTFDDPTTTAPTSGTINSRGDRVVNITDEPSPDGVRIFVTMGTQTAQITADCPTQIVIQVQPGNTYEGVVTCGSATVKTTAGRATISNITNTSATVAAVVVDVTAGQTVKFDKNASGNLTQTLSTSASTITPLTTAINNTHVTAGLQTGTAVTYTVNLQNSVTAAATGGTVPVVVAGQAPIQVAQGDTASVAVGLLPGDVDGSGRVDGKDLVELAAAFGSNTAKPAWNANADQNKDGFIDGADLVILANHFGAVR
ncbi:MAG TPA: Ig-like domain-containing protein, partial [Nitrospiria bacterium]|nr:Ig-like domain-containing protein [Nitrospiria bacterium]